MDNINQNQLFNMALTKKQALSHQLLAIILSDRYNISRDLIRGYYERACKELAIYITRPAKPTLNILIADKFDVEAAILASHIGCNNCAMAGWQNMHDAK